MVIQRVSNWNKSLRWIHREKSGPGICMDVKSSSIYIAEIGTENIRKVPISPTQTNASKMAHIISTPLSQEYYCFPLCFWINLAPWTINYIHMCLHNLPRWTVTPCLTSKAIDGFVKANGSYLDPSTVTYNLTMNSPSSYPNTTDLNVNLTLSQWFPVRFVISENRKWCR